jgi:hypothetical protein
MNQEQSDAPLAFREELTQAIEIWNDTPVSILDQQAVHTHALLLAMGNTSPIAKKEGTARMPQNSSTVLLQTCKAALLGMSNVNLSVLSHNSSSLFLEISVEAAAHLNCNRPLHNWPSFLSPSSSPSREVEASGSLPRFEPFRSSDEFLVGLSHHHLCPVGCEIR